MKTGTRVIVTFGEGTDLDPSPGKVIDLLFGSENGLLIKVLHDNGQENWHLAKMVSPLLRPVS
ncbi:hypothetical protein GV827_19800 [Sulfitobacter sp. JBTF-M27]|jgi:hypothetical protein|uniref:Uncharacterized protein n=1 Tax=Sulfitobacter sediminilitoris TaxID=2698830 RepID=A0A6P0CFC2_9RHOB|nr:hypothetical protein [Sulfitobacter sediminilitoris]NEK24627.1 hypothetical protein [Sulfitobacter sediminilitoris]